MALSLAVSNDNAQTPDRPTEDLGRKRRWFRAYEENKTRELAEMQEARRYYHGKQWTDAELRKLKSRGQPAITDNRIGRKIDFLVGVEQRMRRDPKAFPRTPQHEHDADVATAALRYVADINRWESKASDVAHDGLVSGVGIVWVGVDPAGQMGPDVKLKSVSVDRFFYDPRSERPDFTDARYMGLHLWLDIDEAKEKWPDQADKLESMVDRDADSSGTMKTDQDRDQQWGDFEQRRIRIVEFWEKKLYTAPMMNTTSLTPPKATTAWYFCFFTGEVLLENGLSPYLDEDGVPDCPYVAWSPYVDEKGDRYSPIRNMRSMQDEINHRRSKFLHMINVRQTHVRTGSVDDIDKLRQELARPDGVIVHNGTEWGKDVGTIDQRDQIQGQAELLAQAQSALENLGPNPGLIGKGGGVADQSGRAILAQRDSGMTELSPVFERLRDWKLRVYRKMWARIKQSWTQERWIRVTDDDGAAQFVGVNQYGQDPQTGQLTAQNIIGQIDVDIILDEGPDTIIMQEELLQTLGQLGEAATGPVGKLMIEMSNVPNKERLLKKLDEANAPPPEMLQMQARMAALEEALKAAQIDEKVAGIENKRADTLSKLITASTPQQQQTDEFGMPSGPPPASPDLMGAMNALAMFPLNYSEPLLTEQAIAAGAAPPPDMQQQPGPQGMDPSGMGAPPQEFTPPEEQMPGGLPLDPALAGV